VRATVWIKNIAQRSARLGCHISNDQRCNNVWYKHFNIRNVCLASLHWKRVLIARKYYLNWILKGNYNLSHRSSQCARYHQT
jgi:hypothetical protein